ncbi:MmcQ/YjbR family DNA-binding protein [Lacticaseibacillus manihotivorans]|uniref:MmcQ/YjbR family DNA-binding protein n=1 Tax=Lacticaseibacillus manihotivorans TaxID=88233 RepID=UPI001FB51334|nr:MmcQ/YjbR family DNA-binding protein [Lacticaseibacillus manihotivorans]
MLTVQPDRIGRTGKKPLEILDLRMADPLQVDGVNFLPGYHMNKKSWFTVVLDGTVATEQLMALMATSFDLAAK